jgi:hypothetical protein
MTAGKEGASTDTANDKTGQGGAGGGDDSGSDGDDDDDEGDDGEPAPTIESLTAELKRANERAARLRRERNKLAGKPTTTPPAGKEEDRTNDAIAKLEREIRVRDAVEALMAAPGFNGSVKAARRAVKSFDSLDPDDIESQIDEYKDDNPAMFKKSKRVAAPAGSTRGSGTNPDADKDGGGGNWSEASRKMLGMVRRGA